MVVFHLNQPSSDTEPVLIQNQAPHRNKSLRRRSGRRVWVACLAWMGVIGTGAYCFSQAAETPPQDGQMSWEKVVAAGKKDGKVVVSVPPGSELRRGFKDQFERRFGIELELVAGRGSAIVRRIADEYRAGVRYFDVHTGGAGTIIYGLAEMMEPVQAYLILPEVKEAQRWWGGHMYVDKENRYAYSFLAFVQEAIWYNTTLMKPDEIRTYDDLLHAKWLEKIGYSDPRAGGAGQGNWTFLWKTRGEDYLRKLTQQKLVLMREERTLAEYLAKGNVALTIGLDIDNFGPFVKSGLPVKPLPPLKDGVYPVTGSGILAVIKNPPHPNATKVFMNWFLGREGQESYQRAIGEPTRRLDVETPKESHAVRPAREFMSVEQYHQLESHTEAKQETVRKPAIAAANKLLN
jgi:ABC-type Fe3+ transport system substrate-binding protein